jgi:hypothetical protein
MTFFCLATVKNFKKVMLFNVLKNNITQIQYIPCEIARNLFPSMNAYLEKLKLQGLHYERLFLHSSTLQGSPTKFHQIKMKSLKHCNDIMSQSICFAQFSALAQSKSEGKNSRHDICTKKAHNCIQTFTIHS